MKNKYLLIGNPNVGKSTLYNLITGKNEKVSNFEGVTVQKKEANIKNSNAMITDLPGIGGLNSSALIDNIVIETLLLDEYDAIYYIADINNLKRNLYLLLDILETGNKVNLILNMNDLFEGSIEKNNIANLLNVNLQRVSRKDKEIQLNTTFKKNNFIIKYNDSIEKVIEELITKRNDKKTKVSDRFLVMRVLNGNKNIQNEYFDDSQNIDLTIKNLEEELVKKGLGSSLVGILFLEKRKKINQILKDNYSQEKYHASTTFANKYLDKILLHKFGGYIAFALVMWLVFTISFDFSFLGDYIDGGVAAFSSWIQTLLIGAHINPGVISFIIDGAIAGVGGILTFLPQIIILFTLLTVLEGVGYFARVTILFEHLFDKIGLSAHSLIPLISGLGCNVLSIMSARTIKNESKRIATIMASPFISCNARFPIYIIFVNIFFQKNQGLILLSIYLLGILVAILVAYVIDKKIYKDTSEMGVVALPKYKRIGIKYFVRMITAKIKSFLTKAGKLIFLGSIVIWILMHFNFSGYTSNEMHSYIYIIAEKISIIFKPLGFGTPQATMSLISAFMAKELAVSSMQVSYGAANIKELEQILTHSFNAISAYSFMVFVLLYIPCISTLGAIYSETKKSKFVIYSILLSLFLGYLFALISYQIGNLLF